MSAVLIRKPAVLAAALAVLATISLFQFVSPELEAVSTGANTWPVFVYTVFWIHVLTIVGSCAVSIGKGSLALAAKRAMFPNVAALIVTAPILLLAILLFWDWIRTT